MRHIFRVRKNILILYINNLRILTIVLMKLIDDMAVNGYNVNRIIICLREVSGMKISYKKLWIMLVEKDISPATLRKDLNIAPGTMTKIRRNEEVALSVLLRICEYLDCNIGEICDAVRTAIE